VRRAFPAVAVALALCAATARAQVRVTIADVGPGPGGPLIQRALRQSHRLVEPDTAPFVVERNARIRTSLIVLGRNTRVDGAVDGDVIVIGGNLYVRTGATVGGRAIAIGGGAYPSSLAVVTGEVAGFRQSTFDIARTADGYRLSYRSLEQQAEKPLLFPMAYGFRAPQYDRVNGLTQPFGPAFAFANARGLGDVVATYRSNLGAIDPLLDLRYQLTRRTRATLSAGRGSFSNDAWIWPDLVNSLSVVALGEDTRNFYRADRADITLFRLWEGVSARLEPFIGAMTERAWSVGPGVFANRGPWSVIGRADLLGMRRPNPAVDAGRLTSLIVGATGHWESAETIVHARARVEASLSSPASGRFQQITSDVAVSFPTFGEQQYALDVHWVTTLGETPPPQRFAYLGGSGTLPFLDMLSQGGDVLLLIDQRYSVPLTTVTVGVFGSPVLQFRHRIGAAGVGGLPSLEQMVGVGLSLTIVRGEIQADPVSRRVRAAAGFTFSR